MTLPPPDPARILQHFPIQPVRWSVHTGGHINDSWRIETGEGSYLLQRLNPTVFTDGALVMRNMERVTRHLASRLESRGTDDPSRRVLRMVPAHDGAAAVRATDQSWWRLLVFIEGTVVKEKVSAPEEAFEAGRAFGEFLELLSDFDGRAIVETIPRFRDTIARVEQLDHAVVSDTEQRVQEIRPELAALDARRSYAELFPPLIASGALPRRVVHNDAKSSNVLRDIATGKALAVVDLDTVMPGTALSDIGDLMRSMASPADEDARDLSRIEVRPDFVAALAKGYFSAAGGIMTQAEREHFVAAGLVTTYEQAVRFFTDFLNGDRYYRTTRPGQNLDRGRAQLRLLLELESQQRELERQVSR